MEMKHPNRRLILGALLGIAALGTGAAAHAADYSATLNASPARYSGKCPGVITFNGTITAGKAGRVQYKFIRSDGAFAPVQTLDFTAPGTKPVSTTWTLGGAALPSYNGWEAIQIVYPASVQSNHANFALQCAEQPAAKPDLVIRQFGLKQWGKCEAGHAVFTFQVTVANIGGAPSPAIAGKALVQAMDQHGNGWGNGAMLGAIPPGGSQTVDIPVYYLQADPNHMTAAAPHPFKAIADPLHLVDEANEGNNESAAINVDPRRICQGATGKKPDLGMYGFLKIGKQQKQVQWGQTITLTPADALLVSGGKPAFDVYYAYREYNGVAVAGPFKNKIFFNGNLVSQQTGLSTGPSQIKNVHTQAYIGPQSGRLEFKIDADNEVAESREDNNAGFFVNVRFSGF
jgi:hypothetical protein